MNLSLPRRGIARLDELPPDKAALARRLLLAGRAVEADVFAARGLELSPPERAWLTSWQLEGLCTAVAQRIVSRDGSCRLVLSLDDGESIETVSMPSGAVCVSTQVGCAVGCRFCASGLDGLRRNLTTAEILEQVVHARREQRVERVVFMGMGEPSHNLEAVLVAVEALRRDGLISPRKQTFSTVGSLRVFEALGRAAVRPALALSLHSADPVQRAELLPRAPREPIGALVAAADHYARTTGAPVQIEWTVLGGVNDSDQAVDALCDLLQGIHGYVNFIVWNAVDQLPFSRPDRVRVIEMVRRVKDRGILATIRDSAGADIGAACGQLARRRADQSGARI